MTDVESFIGDDTDFTLVLKYGWLIDITDYPDLNGVEPTDLFPVGLGVQLMFKIKYFF